MDHDLYNPGDRVMCIDATGNTSLELGKEYTVRSGGTYIIGLEGVTSYQYARRVEHVS